MGKSMRVLARDCNYRSSERSGRHTAERVFMPANAGARKFVHFHADTISWRERYTYNRSVPRATHPKICTWVNLPASPYLLTPPVKALGLFLAVRLPIGIPAGNNRRITGRVS